MATFSQQQGIPIDLYRGLIDVTSVTVDLDANYDHLVAGVAVLPYSATDLAQVNIYDSEGQLFWGGRVQYDNATTPNRIVEQTFIVLQSEPSIQIVVYYAAAYVSLSAYRLAPSAASIFA